MESVIEMRSGSSLRARLFHRFLYIFVRPLLRHGGRVGGLSPLTLRMAACIDWLGALLPPPRGTHVRAVRLPGFRAEWVRAKGVSADRVVLYFHGGGFISCGLRTHRRLVARISAESGAACLSVAYRQLPQVPLAGSVADCVTAYRHLLDQGYAPENIVVAGDSAGGFLAFAAPLKALEDGLPAPAGIVALSPLCDLEHAVRAAHPNVALDAYIPGDRLERLALLLVEGAVPIDPLLSPVNGALDKLPPVLIQVGSKEALRYDAELMGERLATAGVRTRVQVWEDQVHVFQAFADITPEGLTAITEIGGFIASVTGPAEHHVAA